MKNGRVLVVDDEEAILRAVGRALSTREYQVELAQDGRSALDLVRSFAPDLVVLDLNMPDMDGVSVVRELRSWSHVPVLVLSVREDEFDKVEALDTGADDYLTKPFSTDELMARVRALLRRGEPQAAAVIFRSGDLEIDMQARRVNRGGTNIRLTKTEWTLLSELSKHPGKLLTHQWLLERVWGAGYEDDVEVLRVFISQLRKKIEADPTLPKIITTDPGIGYRWLIRPTETWV